MRDFWDLSAGYGTRIVGSVVYPIYLEHVFDDDTQKDRLLYWSFPEYALQLEVRMFFFLCVSVIRIYNLKAWHWDLTSLFLVMRYKL